MSDTLKIGIVFQASLSRVSAQAGFVKGLLEYVSRSQICLLSGSSAGSINALALSTNNMHLLEKTYRNTNFVDKKNLKLDLRNKIIENITGKMLENGAKVEIPFYAATTHVFPFPKPNYFYVTEESDPGYIEDVIVISTAFPFVNGFCRRKFNSLYIDGTYSDATPVEPFYHSDCDMVIILGDHMDYLPPSKLVDGKRIVVYADVTMMMEHKFNRLSFAKRNMNLLFDAGYAYGKIFGETVFKDDCFRENTWEFIRNQMELSEKRRIHELPKSHSLHLKK